MRSTPGSDVWPDVTEAKGPQQKIGGVSRAKTRVKDYGHSSKYPFSCQDNVCDSHLVCKGGRCLILGGNCDIVQGRYSFSEGSVVKNLPANAGDSRDVDSIPGPGRSLRVRNGNSLQYSFLENSMDREPGELQSRGSHKVGHN